MEVFFHQPIAGIGIELGLDRDAVVYGYESFAPVILNPYDKIRLITLFADIYRLKYWSGGRIAKA